MAKEKGKKRATLHQPVVPKVQTAVAWLREMRKLHGDKKVKKGYDARVSE
jgi:hypothetical protein